MPIEIKFPDSLKIEIPNIPKPIEERICFLLDAMTEAVKRGNGCSDCVQSMIDWSTKVQQTAAPAEPVAPVEPVAPEAEPTATVPDHPAEDDLPFTMPEELPAGPAPVKYTKAQIQSKIIQVSRLSADAKKQARAVLNRYAESLTDVPEDKYSELMAGLEQIAGGAV